MSDENEYLICPECGWGGDEADAVDVEGPDTVHGCPECGSVVFAAS